MFIVIIVLIIAIAIWWGFTQYQATSLENLKETGFEIDYKLESSIPVAFDEDARKIAFVALDKVLVYDYAQVRAWEWETRKREGWANKEAETVYSIVFHLDDPGQPTLRIENIDSDKIPEWKQKLADTLSDAHR